LLWRVPIVCEAITAAYQPKTVVDAGCAIGDLVQGFLELGVDAYGIEGSEAARDYLVVPEKRIFWRDLRTPIDVGSFDLAVCFEVIEHIDERYEDVLLENLTSLSDAVVCSIAGPGQKGHRHVNLKPYEYWEDKFLELGFERDAETEERLKHSWSRWRDTKGIKAYYGNLRCFQKG